MATAQPSSLLFPDATAHQRLINSVAMHLPQDQAASFQSQALDCMHKAQARGFVTLLLSKSAAVMAQTVEKDIEGSYQVLFEVLDRLKDPADLPKCVKDITADLRSSTDDKPSLRLKLLCNFYNRLTSGSEERFDVLLSIIEYARDTKQLEVLTEFFENLDSWKANWKGLTVANERKLYLLVSETLQQAPGQASEAQRLLIKYLATFEGDSDSSDLAEVHPFAVKGIIGAIREPIAALTTVSSLLSLKPVKQLEGHAKYQKVFQLLQIFSYGKLADFLAFCDKNPDVVKEHSIDKDKAVRDMRILSLSLLASEYEEIPYEEVAATLKVPKSEVEDWVVHAITAKLIEARMDQTQEVVMISRSTHRHFTKKEWVKLQEKLTGWRKNVQRILETLKDARSPA